MKMSKIFHAICMILLVAACNSGGTDDQNPGNCGGGMLSGPAEPNNAFITATVLEVRPLPSDTTSGTILRLYITKSENVGTESNRATANTEIEAEARNQVLDVQVNDTITAYASFVGDECGQVWLITNIEKVLTPPPSLASRLAYVVNTASNTISQYTITADGSLVPLSTPTVSTGSAPSAIAVASSGKYAYVANMGGYISQYAIGADGSLTSMSPATVPAVTPYPGQGNVFIAVDPAEKFAYMTNQGSGSISQYTIGADGRLSTMSTPTVATGKFPFFITVHPSGKYVYVTNQEGIAQYTIGAGGGLSLMSTPTVSAGASPWCVTVHPSGMYAYAANEVSGTISQYTIGTDGGLTPMSTPTVGGGAGPASIAIDPSGRYAYLANFGYYINQYTIGDDGSLAPMDTAVVAAGANPLSITVDKSGKYAYVANFGDGTISQFIIGTDGGLTSMSTSTVAAGSFPSFIATVDR